MREGLSVRALRFDERSELERWVLSGDEDRARRARIILLSDDGRSVREIAAAVNCHPINVKKWLHRFNQNAVEGLSELKRGPKKGSRSRFTEEQRQAILGLAGQSPRALGYDFDRWSPQKLADTAMARGIVNQISHVTVRALVHEAGLDERGNGARKSNGSGETLLNAAWEVHEPQVVASVIEEGQRALERGENKEAVEHFRRALEVPGLSPSTEVLVRCRLAEALEGLASYDAALEAVRKYDEPAVLSTLTQELRGRVKTRLGWVYSWLRNHARAIARLNEAIKIYRETEDNEGLAEAHYALGRTYMEIHESSMARDHLERAIELQGYASNGHFLAQVYLRRGTVEFNEGDIFKATAFFERARELADGSNDDNLIGMIAINLGVARIHADQGERDRATEDLERAIHHFNRSGHRLFLVQAYQNLGDNLRYAGEWDRALENLGRALDLAREVRDARVMADPLVTIGEIAFRQGRYEVAQQKLSEALELLRTIEDRWGEAYALRVLGGLHHRMHQPLQALRTLREALHLATNIKDLRGVTAAHLLLAELHIAEERFEQAEEYIELARRAIKADPAQLRSSGLAQRLSGRLELVRGRYAEAQQQIAQSISIFTAVADLYEVGVSHLEMGDFLGQIRDTAQAQRHLDQAIAIFRQLGAAPDLERAEALKRTPGGVRVTAPSGPEENSFAAGGHKASDVLLMQRLIDASASRDLLLQELVSVVEENFPPGRVLLLEQEGGKQAIPELARGFAAEEVVTLAREINSALASGGRPGKGSLYVLDDRAGARVVLYLDRELPSDRLRPLLRQAEIGLENCALRALSRRAAEPSSRVRVETVIPGFIFAGSAMRGVIDRIHKIRTSDVTVLITGESGTGKELVARAVHAESERRRAAFLPFNCTATPKEIIDSQLFGHRRGAFTGATSNYPGIIRAAEGGTLFLDEIGDLALEVQPKLLRFLESGEIQPLGESKPVRVDVRVVAATNTDLERAVGEGRFREDLFHRLNIIRIHVPPLRERREEIPVLAEHFLKHFAERAGKAGLRLAGDAMGALTRYSWPGNVRQLRNEMERVAAYAVAGANVRAADLSPELMAGASGARIERFGGPIGIDADRRSNGRQGTRRSLKEATILFEKKLIEEALDRAGHDLSLAAHELGLSRKGLFLKMSQLGIGRSGERSDSI